MTTAQRRGWSVLLLSLFAGGSIVHVATAPVGRSFGPLVAVGVFYLDSTAALLEFAEMSPYGGLIMNAVYGVLGALVLNVDGYVFAAHVFETLRVEAIQTLTLVLSVLAVLVAVVTPGAGARLIVLGLVGLAILAVSSLVP